MIVEPDPILGGGADKIKHPPKCGREYIKGVFGSLCVLGMAFPNETGSSHTGWTEILVLVWWLVSVKTG